MALLTPSLMIGFGIAALFGTAFLLFTVRARKQATPFVTHYKGEMSWLTDSVRFRHGEAAFTLRRLASNGGLAGTGYFCSLLLELEHGSNAVIAPSDAVKYVYAFSIPEQHSWVSVGGTKVLVTGPHHDAIAARLSAPDFAERLQRLFPRAYSTLTVKRQFNVPIGEGAWNSWTLELTGMPPDVYERPEVLKPILEDMLCLRDLLAA
jgi:hypothetical protein